MAVRATVSDVARAIRAVDSPDVTAELADLLEYASAEVKRIAPSAGYKVHDRAAIAIVGYLYDRPTAGREMAYANVIRNSGAGAMLLPYRIHRGGSTTPAEEPAEEPPDTGLPVRLLGWSDDETIDAADLAAAGVESFENDLPIPQYASESAYLWGATWLEDLPTSVGSSAGPLPRRDDVTFDGREWAVFRSNQFIETRLADFGLSITFNY